MDDYQKMLEMGREAALLNGISQLLDWDQQTYMPKGGSDVRAEQLQLMAKLLHQRRTGAAFKGQLEKLVGIKTGKVKGKRTKEETAAIREWRHDYLKATKLPTAFVQASARLHSQAYDAWRAAREAKSFSRFAPFLEKLIETARKRAEYLGYKEHPFDALVDEYEPGQTRRQIAKLFNSLKGPLVTLRKGLRKHGDPKRDFLHKRFPKAKQMAFVDELLEAVGFDPEIGNVALTTHPFCTSLHPTDVRLTTRVDEHNPADNFLAALHEGGHWIYEANLPAKHFGSPLGEYCSMAIHESQSRTWETIIGQGMPFWELYYPRLQKAFPSQLKGISLQRFYKGLNAVLDTPIRVHADELSYPLHVILRFEIESELIGGKLAIRDLPDAWNSKMEEYLQITPKDDAEGCLQDMHWSAGLFGYFPTYLLGNLYAGQFWATFKAENPKWDLAAVRTWYKEKVHIHGRMYSPSQLVKRVTGQALSAEPYTKYLKSKYKSIYK